MRIWVSFSDDEFDFVKEKAKELGMTPQKYVSYCTLMQVGLPTIETRIEDIYLEMLKDYGSSVIISALSSIEPGKYFKYYEVIGKSKINNKEFTHYKYFKGSSEYDTAEMAHLLDGVIQECENMGIPTLSEEDIRKMRVI